MTSRRANTVCSLPPRLYRTPVARFPSSTIPVANAPLRAPYELQNIGATKAEAAQGMVRFNSGDIKH